MRVFSLVKYPIEMRNGLVQNLTCEILLNKTCISHMKQKIYILK